MNLMSHELAAPDFLASDLQWLSSLLKSHLKVSVTWHQVYIVTQGIMAYTELLCICKT